MKCDSIRRWIGLVLIVPGLEKALEGMKIGESKKVKVNPEGG